MYKTELIETLKKEYQEQISNGKVLDNVRKVICGYFKELEKELQEVIKYSNGKVDVDSQYYLIEDDGIAKFTSGDQYIYFTVNEKGLNIFATQEVSALIDNQSGKITSRKYEEKHLTTIPIDDLQKYNDDELIKLVEWHLERYI